MVGFGQGGDHSDPVVDHLLRQGRPLELVILSPHFDDGVLSLGAAMASWVRAGHRVALVTVLGCDPESGAAAGGWDRRSGFTTEGEAAVARRHEDRRASGRLGVLTTWLPFGSLDYERHGTDGDVWGALATAVSADWVFVPGVPLSHPDHAWIHRLVVDRIPPEHLALYAEQPYTQRFGGAPFEPVPASMRDRVAKWRAIREYRSQLALLAMRRTLRRGPLRLALAVERIAWADGLGGSPV